MPSTRVSGLKREFAVAMLKPRLGAPPNTIAFPFLPISWASPFTEGSAVLIPHAAGAGELRGDVRAIRARPADPSAPEGRW